MIIIRIRVKSLTFLSSTLSNTVIGPKVVMIYYLDTKLESG